MEIFVTVLMLLLVFDFLLKVTFWKIAYVCGVAVAAGIFILLVWPYAIEQSRTQITDFLNDPLLMLDMSVVLTVEVSLQMAFCLLSVHVMNVQPVKKSILLIYRLLYWFPGVLIVPVLFYGLTQLIFMMPGISFRLVASYFALAVLVLIPLGKWGLKRLLPETEVRLELLFLANAIVAVLGIVATVNGRTAVEGSATANIPALLGCIGMTVAGALLGMLIRYIRSVRL